MRRLLTGECSEENILDLVDPTIFLEVEFEAEVVKALTCLLPDYLCGVFAGTFSWEGSRKTADLALIHKSFTHWYVVEVELAGHSFEDHVLPQVRCFRHGEPDDSCITSLVRAFGNHLTRSTAETILRHIPRYVAVVSNMANLDWIKALRATDIEHLTVSIFRSRDGRTAHQVDGRLLPKTVSLGFAKYTATDNCLWIHKGCGLAEGGIRIVDQFGVESTWTVREGSDALWLAKNRGPALLEHNGYVQIMRDADGRIWLRPSSSYQAR